MKTMVLKEKAINMLESLPPNKLRVAVDYLKYLQGDYDTYDVNENIKKAIHEVKAIKEGKVKAKTLKEFLGEL
jgi:hypothetical protein